MVIMIASETDLLWGQTIDHFLYAMGSLKQFMHLVLREGIKPPPLKVKTRYGSP